MKFDIGHIVGGIIFIVMFICLYIMGRNDE